MGDYAEEGAGTVVDGCVYSTGEGGVEGSGDGVCAALLARKQDLHEWGERGGEGFFGVVVVVDGCVYSTGEGGVEGSGDGICAALLAWEEDLHERGERGGAGFVGVVVVVVVIVVVGVVVVVAVVVVVVVMGSARHCWPGRRTWAHARGGG